MYTSVHIYHLHTYLSSFIFPIAPYWLYIYSNRTSNSDEVIVMDAILSLLIHLIKIVFIFSFHIFSLIFFLSLIFFYLVAPMARRHWIGSGTKSAWIPARGASSTRPASASPPRITPSSVTARATACALTTTAASRPSSWATRTSS